MNWHPRPLPNANREALREIREAIHSQLKKELEEEKLPETTNRNAMRRQVPHYLAL